MGDIYRCHKVWMFISKEKSVDVVFFINIHSIRKSYVPSIILFIGLIKLLDNLLDVILIFDHFEKIGLRKFSPTSFIGYIRYLSSHLIKQCI